MRRLFLYGFVLAIFYAFVFAVSMRLGLLDVALPTTAMTLVMYGYFIRQITKDAALDSLRDVAAAVVMIWLMHFGSFVVYTASLGIVVSTLVLLLHVSPIFMWTLVWSDFYWQRRGGRL